MSIKCVCIFAGSYPGSDPAFTREAEQLGEELAKRGISATYGGGTKGLMGSFAKSFVENGGQLSGIIPDALEKLEAMEGKVYYQEKVVTKTMHERKKEMARRADAFIALPGGFGTYEELMEMITWTKLGIHTKTVACVNVNGFYDHLEGLVKTGTDMGFISPSHQKILVSAPTAKEVVEKVLAHDVPKPILSSSDELVLSGEALQMMIESVLRARCLLLCRDARLQIFDVGGALGVVKVVAFMQLSRASTSGVQLTAFSYIFLFGTLNFPIFIFRAFSVAIAART
eukprot:CAMPEP_0113880310 /NCGR_PEP_ID=MMETSP0780_2-20120614/7713_1 /TAXON_ID=652834 /ORGANISM="Palpitomonas bilix" /LENGTH=284 /DNA_ID=CAMNT_0000866969 /DNA_START=64 /DNA_END=915 /DNA_ORIENTATION=+ /assembly_acc=CAM_ASM_000599